MPDVTPEDLDRWEAAAETDDEGPWLALRLVLLALIAEVRRLRALLDDREGTPTKEDAGA